MPRQQEARQKQQQSTYSSPSSYQNDKPSPSVPRPSSSILLLSPTNEVLLLHRVRTSSTFASAHVFPGGNLDPFHEDDIPAPASPQRHEDGPAYRLGAIRECFEETGILLAKDGRDGGDSGALLNLSSEDRDAARRKIHSNEVKFADWLKSVGGVPDTQGLTPFTRWITPVNQPKRFTTQMYIYQLPISRRQGPSVPSEMLVPTPDGGLEHTAALFAPPLDFLSRASSGEILLFPPQYFLLHLVGHFLNGTAADSSLEEGPLHFTSQRRNLRAFLRRVPAADTEAGKKHRTASIPWGEKVIGPRGFMVRESDGRVVLGLDWPGEELKGSERGGDWERVVLVKFTKSGPRQVEVRRREDVLEEERKLKAGGQEKL